MLRKVAIPQLGLAAVRKGWSLHAVGLGAKAAVTADASANIQGTDNLNLRGHTAPVAVGCVR